MYSLKCLSILTVTKIGDCDLWRRARLQIKKKDVSKKKRNACALPDRFGLHFLDALMRASRRLPAFLHCRSTYYVVCRCPCGSLQKKKDHIRVLQLLRRLNVGNGRTRYYFLVELYLLFVMDWRLQWGFLVGFCVALCFSAKVIRSFMIVQQSSDLYMMLTPEALSLYKLWTFYPL